MPRTLIEAGISASEIVGQATEPVTPAVTPTATPAAPAFAPIPVQVNGAFTSGPGAGYDRSFIGLDGFVPLTQTPGQDLTYLQGRLLLTTEGGHPGGNILVGYRRFNPASNSFWGGYLGYDVR
jgi:hypothetical protein